jgi:hypothetical protein
MHHYEAWRSLRLSAWPRLLDGALVSAARRLLADIERPPRRYPPDE